MTFAASTFTETEQNGRLAFTENSSDFLITGTATMCGGLGQGFSPCHWKSGRTHITVEEDEELGLRDTEPPHPHRGLKAPAKEASSVLFLCQFPGGPSFYYHITHSVTVVPDPPQASLRA